VAASSDIRGSGVGGGTASLDSQLPQPEGLLMVGDKTQPSDEEIVNHLTGRADSERVTDLIGLATTPARVNLVQDPDTGEQRWMLTEAEWDLIGLVCDQIDRANPDLPIEVCQAIAKDIIKLVREYT
jgi:hypothetical protein